LQGTVSDVKNLRQAERYLPDNIYDALTDFRGSEWISKLFGDDVKGATPISSRPARIVGPRLLGAIVKPEESPVPSRSVQSVNLWNLF